MTHDPTKTAAADAAGTAADYSARATYARGWEDGAKTGDEVGIQLVAAQAVIARMRAVIVALDRYMDDDSDANLVDLGIARGRLDTVPGDALAPIDTEAP